MKYEQPGKRRRRIREALVSALGQCWFCGYGLDATNATLDHLKPRCAGGGDEITNLRLACWICNYCKDDQPVETVVVGSRRGQGVLRKSHRLGYLNRIGAR